MSSTHNRKPSREEWEVKDNSDREISWLLPHPICHLPPVRHGKYYIKMNNEEGCPDVPTCYSAREASRWKTGTASGKAVHPFC